MTYTQQISTKNGKTVKKNAVATHCTCSFSADGVGEGNILAISILTWRWGSRYTKFLHGRSIFEGSDVLVPIPKEPYTTCDFPVGPGLSAPSGSVRPYLDLYFFLFFTSQSTIFQLRRDGSSCVEPVLS